MSLSDRGLPRGERPSLPPDGRSTGILRLPARSSYLSLVGNVVRWFAGLAGLTHQQGEELELAVDEACTNVIRYAFPEAAEGEMTLVFSPCDQGLEVTIQDRGIPFDPREGKQAAEQKRARDPASGGRGLLLIDRLTDAVRYCWDEQQGNRLTLVKHR
jgi:serine/threonine-protein kinase RsbW